MAGDKFSALWVSHSSISDFLECPRAYYLKHVYRDPKTGHKIKLMSPPLALGSAVHEVIEALSVLPTATRFSEPLAVRFEEVWQRVSGKKGGFFNAEVEALYKNRGLDMLSRVKRNPGPLTNQAVKIREPLPWYWLSEDKNIILCGKVDWLEYLPATDSVHIIDFKTSKQEDREDSLQLPIYHLLVHNTQRRPVTRASYWYIAFRDELTPKVLPDLKAAEQQILEIAIQMKTARQLNIFKCPEGDGCRACKPFEAILRGEAEYIGCDAHNTDVYVLRNGQAEDEDESFIL
ncbi:MAG: PD-(D/E)XK nuclease family protein [Patescibacteria group bacterium]|nr:PD-(D/E)XK nuclease family protein [Patescibacteria group bacterium]